MANTLPRIFLDTSVLKLAATHVVRGYTRQRTIQWGDHTVTLPLTQYRIVLKPPKTGQQMRDALRLPLIAKLAARKKIELLTQLESILEFGRLPDTDCPLGRFFGAPITTVNGPKPWYRVIADGRDLKTDHQFNYLRSHPDQRYKQLQIAVGVKPNASPRRIRNQMLDAWHIRCAEEANANYFLTVDYSLIRHLEGHRRFPPTVKVVTPTELLRERQIAKHIRITEVFELLLQQFRFGRLSQPDSPLEQLAAFGETLERQGYYDEQ